MIRLVAFLSGLVFGVGLCVSGMTQPTKVIGFLDVAGDWDPSLGLVMAGAIGVHAFAARWARSAASPRLAPTFLTPTRTEIDASLVIGSLIFGVGWGLVGYCPGPALTSSATLAPGLFVFLGAMVVGMLGHTSLDKLRR